VTVAPDPAALLALAVRLAADAGALLRERPADLQATTKSTPTDAVTVMDAASERLIIDGLYRHRPGDPVVAEESGSRPGTGPVTWHVDPLDGTVNYLYDLPAWSVSIAAVVGDRTVAGVVFDPDRQRMFTATVDDVARCNGQPIRCSDPAGLPATLVATGFSYDAGERERQATVAAHLLPRVRDIRRAGSAALDLCSVAAGRVDAYYEEGGHSWDWLAGELIVARAGGRTARSPAGVTGHPLLAAAGPTVIGPLCRLLTEAGVPGLAAGSDAEAGG
jgi:myo-inositol-1(or 4)-monophosphatase